MEHGGTLVMLCWQWVAVEALLALQMVTSSFGREWGPCPVSRCCGSQVGA